MSFKINFLLYFTAGTFCLFGQTSTWEIVESMGRGINLGNTLSAPVEGNWAPAVYQQFFEDVSNAGFDNVRIPMDFYGSRTSGSTINWSSVQNTFDQFTGSESDYIINSTYLDRIESVVNWALDLDLYTIIDIHGAELKSEFLETFNASNSSFTHPTSAKRAADLVKFKSIWIQIANRFNDYPSNLIFEVINEPYFEISSSEMNELNMLIIDAIRSTGGNNAFRPIIITGGSSSSYQAPFAISEEVLEFDSNLIASFHYYQPFNFTSSSREEYNNFNWGSVNDKSIVDLHFDEVKQWSQDNNIPVTLGEFGADNENGINYNTGVYGLHGGPINEDRVEYHRYIAEQAINRGFSFSAWCSGNKSNKTIHLRNDNPDTNNSVDDIWVNDVKEALLLDGLWPDCYGPYEDLLVRNSDFECGVTSDWSFSVYGSAQATLSQNSDMVFSGSVAAEIEVVNPQNYNKVLLSNTIYEQELNDKTIIIGCYAKSSEPNMSFKLRIKSQIDGSLIYVPSEAYELTSTYEYYEFQYVVPENTSYVQLQVMMGQNLGLYFLDAFSYDIVDTSLSVDFESQNNFMLYPNPVDSRLNIRSNSDIDFIQVFDNMGKFLFRIENIENFDFGELSNGVYWLNIIFNNNSSKTKKIILN